MNSRVSPGPCAQHAVGVRGALERAQHRGADRDHAPTPRPRPRDKVGRHGRHLVPLGMHHMVLDSLCPDRQEGAGADVQRDEGMLDLTLRQRRHQRRGEMQRRGRRRDRARPAREQRLIVVAIARVAAARPLDVGRQRHRAIGLELPDQTALVAREPQRDLAPFAPAEHLARKIRREFQAIARPALARGPRERPPAPALLAGVQGHLDHALAASADEAGRQHPGVVEHQQVARLEQVRQIEHAPVLQACLVRRPGALRNRAAAPAAARSARAAGGSRTARCARAAERRCASEARAGLPAWRARPPTRSSRRRRRAARSP